MTDKKLQKALRELKEMQKNFTQQQSEAFAFARMNMNLFITGGPGTGKSYLTRAIIKELECVGQSVLVMAPTGVAAININGTTIHRALGLGKGEVINVNKMTIRAKKCPLLDSADTVIIDEVSMVRMDLFEYIEKSITASEKRTGKKIQVIVIGDFHQLPPVMLPESKKILEEYYGSSVGRGYCFQSKSWQKFNFETVILKTCIRQQDKEFIDALNFLRVGDTTCMPYLNSLSKEDSYFPYLVSTNPKADRINAEKLKEAGKKYGLPPYVFDIKSEGDVRVSDFVVPAEISLYPGVRVMLVVNDPVGRYQNGSCGTVHQINGDSVEVILDNGRKKVTISPYTWKVNRTVILEDGKIHQEECGSYTQLPLKLAYAITIHKSQGQTYDAVNIDTSCWEVAQLYVALSRVRTPIGVHLMDTVKSSSIIVDPAVISFYQNLKLAGSEKNKMEQQSFDFEETKDGTENKETCSIVTKEKRSRVGRPSPFEEGTKRIRVGMEMADYIQELCKRQAVEGGQIRLLPDELDICVSDVLDAQIDYTTVTFMAVPLELEGKFRREIKNYEKRSNQRK